MQEVITAIDEIEQQEAIDEYKEMFRAFLPISRSTNVNTWNATASV